MKLQVYSVRDTKSEIFNVPFYGNTHGEAERSFITVANDPKSNIYAFPEDYDLWHLGQYDQQTGILAPLPTPVHMLKALAVVKKDTAQKQDIQNH